MSSAKEFREYAEECRDLGSNCSIRAGAKDIFQEMAQTWLVAAMRREVGSPTSSKNVETGDAPNKSLNNKLSQ